MNPSQAAAKKMPISATSAARAPAPSSAQPTAVPATVPPAGSGAAPSQQPAEKAKNDAAAKKAAAKQRRNELAKKKRAEKRAALEAKAKANRSKQAATSGGGTTAAGQPSSSSTAAVPPKGPGISHPVTAQPPSTVTSPLTMAASMPGSASTVASTTSGAMTPSTASVTSTSSSKVKEKSKSSEPSKKKKKKTTTTTKSSSSSVLKRKNSLSQPNKLMDNIDHAVLIDVKTIPQLLSRENKLDVNLDEEQRILLYGDEARQAKVRDITKAAAAALDDTVVTEPRDKDVRDTMLKEVGVLPLPWKLPAIHDGWGEKNVLSVRTAWAKVRLPESEALRAEREREEKDRKGREPQGASSSNLIGAEERPPVMTEGVLSSPLAVSSALTPQEGSGTQPTMRIEDDTTNHVWYDEKRAEQDPTLALLSEATELFLKSAVEEAIGKARLRQNLDGVRLWHTIHASSAAAIGSKDNNANSKPPPALIRLGCDVRRQIALAEGNAAKTYQRMEEAISRQNDSYHMGPSSQDPGRMLLESTSMADLSKRPPLMSAVQTADLDAKRKYAVFGGSESQEPPLGRVPKKAKVTLQDIAVGHLGNRASMIGARRKRFRVGLY